MNKYVIGLGIICIGLMANGAAVANNVKYPYSDNFDAGTITFSTSLGLLGGEW